MLCQRLLDRARIPSDQYAQKVQIIEFRSRSEMQLCQRLHTGARRRRLAHSSKLKGRAHTTREGRGWEAQSLIVRPSVDDWMAASMISIVSWAWRGVTISLAGSEERTASATLRNQADEASAEAKGESA